MNHIEIPELAIQDKQPLIDYFYSKQDGVVPNTYKGLNFLDLDETPDCIQSIINKINPEFFRMIYYCVSNSDIEKHTDHRRSSAISIELINEHDIPISYEDGDSYYHVPILMNTWKPHWVSNPNNGFRLFVHIDLNRDLLFDDYVVEYNKGNLIV